MGILQKLRYVQEYCRVRREEYPKVVKRNMNRCRQQTQHRNSKRKSRQGSLGGEGDLEPLAVVGHGAATTDTLHDWVVAAAATVTGRAVDEVVAELARLGAGVLALEDTGVHVRRAGGALSADAATLHVDVLGDVEGTRSSLARGRSGELEPGVLDTAEDGLAGVGGGGSASSRDALGGRDLDGLALLHADRDGWRVDVEGHAGEAALYPAVPDSVLAGVGHIKAVGGIAANPQTAVARLCVDAHLGADSLTDAGDTGHQIADDVVGLVRVRLL